MFHSLYKVCHRFVVFVLRFSFVFGILHRMWYYIQSMRRICPIHNQLKIRMKFDDHKSLFSMNNIKMFGLLFKCVRCYYQDNLALSMTESPLHFHYIFLRHFLLAVEFFVFSAAILLHKSRSIYSMVQNQTIRSLLGLY